MVALRLEHVWKLFGGDANAVADLTLNISDREFLVLVGPSGCGKTTTLRMLAGLETPSYGRIWMNDTDITDLPPGQRDVGMVFQSYALYPHMTVYENLAFGPKVRHELKPSIRQRVQDVASLLEIGSLLDRKPDALSGGQRQRVALGRAMIREPKVFLMDEPLSNLDAALRVQMRAELIRLHNRLEVTTVYVTHDQVEALTMGHRVAVLKGGQLLQVDAPTALYDNPANINVATFIGSPRMNIIPGGIASLSGSTTIECLGATFSLPPGRASALVQSVGSEIKVGLRPDDIHLAVDATQASPRFHGTVDVCEHTGTDVFATVDVKGEKVMAKLPRSIMPRPGDGLEVCFDPNDVYLFDPATGNRALDRVTGGVQ